MNKTIDRCALLAGRAAEIINQSDDPLADRLWPFIGELADQLRHLSCQLDDNSLAITQKWASVALWRDDKPVDGSTWSEFNRLHDTDTT